MQVKDKIVEYCLGLLLSLCVALCVEVVRDMLKKDDAWAQVFGEILSVALVVTLFAFVGTASMSALFGAGTGVVAVIGIYFLCKE